MELRVHALCVPPAPERCLHGHRTPRHQRQRPATGGSSTPRPDIRTQLTTASALLHPALARATPPYGASPVTDAEAGPHLGLPSLRGGPGSTVWAARPVLATTEGPLRRPAHVIDGYAPLGVALQPDRAGGSDLPAVCKCHRAPVSRQATEVCRSPHPGRTDWVPPTASRILAAGGVRGLRALPGRPGRPASTEGLRASADCAAARRHLLRGDEMGIAAPPAVGRPVLDGAARGRRTALPELDRHSPAPDGSTRTSTTPIRCSTRTRTPARG